MIVCTSCGHANEAGAAFCGSCRAFLEWSGQPTAVGLPAPRRSAEGSQLTASMATVGSPDVAGDRDAECASPVAVPPAPEQAPAPPRPVVVADLPPGGRHCGACGVGNAAGRFYCRACGSPLDDALPAAVGRVRWWVRVTAWLHPAARPAVAGDRPGGWSRSAEPAAGPRRRWRPRLPARLSVSALLIPLMILSAAGLGIAPVRAKITEHGFSLYHDLRAKLAPQFVPVTPLGATATSVRAGHAARSAIDRVATSYWAAAGGSGVGQSLRLTFAAPVDLDRLGVLSGAPGADFVRAARPSVLRVTGSDGSRRDVPLTDAATFQQHGLALRGVTWLRLQIVSAYPGQSAQPAAVREVELFRKD